MASLLPAAGWIAAGVIAFLLPGAAWLAWAPAAERDPFERLAEAAGLSLALTALVGLLMFVLGLRFDSLSLTLVYAALALLAAAGWLRHRPRLDYRHALALAALAALLAWRLYQARGLVLPVWVDPLHHVLLVRLMLETGGVPATLEPYLPVALDYHFAFHSLAAAFAALARLAPDRAVLLIGQAVGALISLSVYRLGKALWGDFRRAALAALLVGFFTEMPAYYLTWGRYTLLAGLVLLPLAMAAALDALRAGDRAHRVESGLRLAALTGGTLLAHYLTALMLALFLVCLGVYLVARDLRRRALDRGAWAALLGGSLGGLLLAAPWIVRIWIYSRQSFQVGAVLPSGAAAPTQDYLNYLWSLMGPQQNYFFLALAALGLLLVWRWRGERLAAGVWAVLVALMGLPWGLRVGPFQPHHFVIVLFLPATLFAADLLASACEALGKVTRRGGLAWAAAGLLAAGLLAWGVRATASVINPVTVLATAADRTALDWAAAHTPPAARFFINATFWQGGVYRGVDGGAWLLPLTGRWTIVPPPIFGFGPTDYVRQINAWDERASRVDGCTPDFWALVDEARLDYVYLREGSGALQPAGLEGCPRLEAVYHAGGVWIYAIAPAGG